ncbi:glyoxylase-like metal-dependent hydrolase (beta-lactamase superfamily II) [Pseudaminobacter salicylatoxidans]|uniref:Glyoxylase-like metal-dependent hydrolase (Beta-lactamase superfamily II) n=1 Tax=Pseudaminobacter salicylatoxidans TaxID=93369 RepID=A0A316C588_PSESE|nr:MBL fold metallo-hydrolase [Pseudaminobacter salicylatoxidans]PWJ84473.1 glyoxylase-like metal-dependent hydrolase (beta-lactamase superfamily II) [Pseudaminobacter salicylatoxidans]
MQHNGRHFGRRAFLQAGLGVAAALALPEFVRPGHSSGRLEIGDGEILTFTDGTLTLPVASTFPDVAKQELDELLAANGMAADMLTPDCNVTILRRGDKLVIFDVGAGSNFLSTTGKLLENLAAADIDPADVTDVVLTHAHPDHLWGVTDDFDELVFSNASYHIGQVEWDFWSSSDALSAMPEDRQTFVVGAQNRFEAIGDRIAFMKPGDEVLPGVEAVDTAGHTPGHLSFLIHGAGEKVLVAGDAISNAVVSFARPDWPTASDQDPQLGAKTRSILLDRLVGEEARLIGYHLPHPGAGRVERKDSAYRFVPV